MVKKINLKQKKIVIVKSGKSINGFWTGKSMGMGRFFQKGSNLSAKGRRNAKQVTTYKGNKYYKL